eukprot:4088511-Amphidinium_carterae.1
MDIAASNACQNTTRSQTIHCISTLESHGLESLVTKYIALAVVAQLSDLAVWLDLDVYLPMDPTPQLRATMESAGTSTHLAFAQSIHSRSIVPAIVVASGREASTSLFLRYASWLQASPYIQDHQGWDVFLQHGD